MAQDLHAIRQQIRQLTGKGPGRRYPAELQQQIAYYARERLSEGHSAQAVSREAGVSWQTIRRWIRLHEHEPCDMALFAPIRLVEAHSEPTASAIEVSGPAGLVIRGLDVASLAELLRRLQ